MYKNINGLRGFFSNDKVLFWGALFIAAVCFVCLFSDICFSFSIGFLLAYLFTPIVDRISGYLNRTFVSFLFTVGLLLFFILIIINVFPIIAGYFSMISDNAPIYYRKSLDLIAQLGDSLGIPQIRDSVQNLQLDLLKYIDQKIYILSSLARGIASQYTAVTGFVSSLVIMVLSFFYFLKDWNVLKQRCFSIVPIRQKSILHELGVVVRKTLKDFLEGQLCVVVVLSVYYGGFLWVIGVDHFAIIGIISGFFSFIPFIGALISLIIAIFVSAMSLSLGQFYCIIATYLIGQFVEGYILSPKFVGKTTGLHPLWILFSFFAGYQLKGVIGVLIAIPFMAVINNLVIFSVKQFRASQIYKQ